MSAVATRFLEVSRIVQQSSNFLGLTQDVYDRVIKANMDDYSSSAFFNIPNTKYNFIQVAMGYKCSILLVLILFRGFIGDIINNIESVVTNQTQQAMALFSGHDTTVLP